MAANVWSQVRQEQRAQPNSIWDSLGNIEDEPLAPGPVDYAPVVVDNEFPLGTIAFDLETGSVKDMWTCGQEFVRLVGHCIDGGEIQNYASPAAVIEDILGFDGWIISHNGMNFDAVLLDRLYGVSILHLAKRDRLIDTKLLAFLADPPASRTTQGEIEKRYSLQTVGTKYLGEGKMVDVVTGNSVLKELAKIYGGFDQIPQDHPEYNEYLKRDVEVTRDLARVLPMSDYTRREHRIAAVCATISIQGFRVDVPLLEERIKEGEDKRARILAELSSYGLPSPESTKAPQRTSAGIDAINTAFVNLGVTLPRSEKTNRPMMGKDVLQGVIDNSDSEEAADLAEAIQGLNGVRTIFKNIQDNLIGDRVHPNINLRQSTGRLSITDPGLTVIGKREGKVTERAVFLPDEGCVLISADLAQVDARAVAGLSQDTEYLKLFEDGRDLHAEMAQRILGDAQKRDLAKAVVHAVNYGMQAKKLSLTTGLDLYQAECVISEFENNFPVLTRWRHKVREQGQTTGVLYNGFGRLMKIEPERAFTQSPALLGQSTARDLLMEGILHLWALGGESVMKMIRGIIHDEIVLSVRISDVEEVEQLVIKAMSFPWCPEGGQYPVKIEAGLGRRGQTWMNCYDK